MDDTSDIQSYYDAAGDQELDRLNRHQLEHDITWRYLDTYLPSEGSILEIGCGAGTITIGLVRRGYDVTAVDFSPNMIELCERRMSDEGLEKGARFSVKDARNLGDIGNESFDAVLMMGPLYHLVLREDREAALGEAFNCLRPGAILFSSFISRYGIWGDVMKKTPETIENQIEVRSVLDEGRDREGAHTGGFRGYFAVASEIPLLHEEIGFSTLVLAGVEPCISADDESYNNLRGERRRLWLDLLYEVSTEWSTIAASRHLLYIGQKTE
jgi:SAM-dependent methyltransferase